ncbi:sulfite exporter TauE/SafE family protein [Mariniflexile ostreae]|uniref:Probable membrane transporter protein n=1 Tax=Mariniflexile ostreae TaxID=1520892 RepID=A0ABV5F8S5_9FLAO
MELITVYILSVIFTATLVRSTFGFGESLIAVPLLLFVIPVETAVPLSVLISVFIAAIVVAQDRKQIHFESAKWLILFGILGIPLGLVLLFYGNETLIKIGLAFLIILYASYSLFSKKVLKLEKDHKIWLFVCGFLSGILGGAYGLNGPPLVVYGNLRHWTAKRFRATLQAYFLPASIVAMCGYAYKGLWNTTVTYYFFISIPVIIPAIFLGRYLNHQLKEGHFLKYIYMGLICVGILLLSNAIL